MHENDSEAQQELSTQQEQELVNKILEFKPYLKDYGKVPGLATTYILPDKSVSLYIANDVDLPKESLHSSIVVTKHIPGITDWQTQDAYFISRFREIGMKLRFDREYMKLVIDESGEPFMERFPSDIKKLEILATESTDSDHKRYLNELIEMKIQENIDFAEQFDAIGHCFTVERYNKLMSILGSIDPKSAPQNIPTI